ncbi:hypothetical protein BUALT_Bualt14G0041600 [Buddleja alternifolia]|uniref:Nicotianamine synthase n=1 Tax=Buddleja alternifolia TaxID=168488 RepID=A0AAV6WG39_9LAMI|nr:hypothetical protein BUALT_Bualt14G0041600 [Buddleja alternifolia]
MVCLRDPLIQKVCELYGKISKLDNLSPSKDVDTLFTQLVITCIPPYPMDVNKLCTQIQDMRTNLIRLCGNAEGLLEKHYSTILGSYEKPLHHLQLFPYYSNYLKLGGLEFDLLSKHCPTQPTRLAFVGSGPLPLTSIVLASHHLTSTVIDNYDIDESANSMAGLEKLRCCFLGGPGGDGDRRKDGRGGAFGKAHGPGAILMLRSAHGARAFLYPVVEPRHLRGFEVLSVFHPTDDVINSVVVARKCPKPSVDKSLIVCIKCGDQLFNSLGHKSLIEELAVQEHLC